MSIMKYVRRIQRYIPSNSSLVKLSLFHDKRGGVWDTLRNLVDGMDRYKIDYAVIGGLAVYIHGYERTTNDCDILLTKKDFEQFKKEIVGRYVKPTGSERMFLSIDTKIPVDILVEGDFPGDSKDIPMRFPSVSEKSLIQSIGGINVICLSKLIELKLCSFMCSPINRNQDKSDVVKLIMHNKLGPELIDQLHPYVHSTYIEIVEGIKEYDAKYRINKIG